MPAEDDYGQRRQQSTHPPCARTAPSSTSGSSRPTNVTVPPQAQPLPRSARSQSSVTPSPSPALGSSTVVGERFIVGTLSTEGTDRYGPQSSPTHAERYSNASVERSDRYATDKIISERFPTSTPQVERYATDKLSNERYSQTDRYSFQDRMSPANVDRYGGSCDRFSTSCYIPPPSPAPNSDRFIPGPMPSPAHSDRFNPVGERYRTVSPNPERFNTIAGTTVERYRTNSSPSRTERFRNGSPKNDRFQTTERLRTESPNSNPDRFGTSSTERFIANSTPVVSSDRFGQMYGSTERFLSTSAGTQIDRYPSSSSAERFLQTPSPLGTSERYLPPNAHTPVERYVPPPSPEGYNYPPHYPTYVSDRYVTPTYPTPNTANPGDPYMRRDLGYHHHYRLANPAHQYQQYHGYRVRHMPRLKCCPSPSHFPPDSFLVPSASPGSSSSSSTGSAGLRESFNREYQTIINQRDPNRDFNQTPVQGIYQGPAQYAVNQAGVTPFNQTQTRDYSAPNAVVPREQNTPANPQYTTSLQQNVLHAPQITGTNRDLAVGVTYPSVNITRDFAQQNVSYSAVPVNTAREFVQPNVTLTRDFTQTNVNLGFTISQREYVRDFSPLLNSGGRAKTPTPSCKHTSGCSTPSIEYLGASGGRHVSVVQPPSGTLVPCDDPARCSQPPCCSRRSPALVSSNMWRAPTLLSASQVAQPAQSIMATPPNTMVTSGASQAPPNNPALQEAQNTQQLPSSPVQRAISLPTRSDLQEAARPPRRTPQYTMSERLPQRERHPRPGLERSMSRKEQVKQFIKRETATFFGVDEDTEDDQQARWLDRRKRLASRRYGPLKDEYEFPTGGVRASTIGYGASGASPREPRDAGGRPDILPARGDEPDGDEVELRHPVRRKDSVARMTFNGLSYVVNTITRHRPRPRSQVRQWSRSFPPEEVSLAGLESPQGAGNLEDEYFFEAPADAVDASGRKDAGDGLSADLRRQPRPFYVREADRDADLYHQDRDSDRDREVQTERDRDIQAQHERDRANSWRRSGVGPAATGGPGGGASRISSTSLNGVLDNSNRRSYGMGIVGKVFGRRAVRQSTIERHRAELDDLEDHRPFFTYWVSTVQLLVLVISLVCYGLGPMGIDMANRSGQVLVTSLSLQQVDYQEPANFWLGPRAADLIHLGAKFAPCMRRDMKILQGISKGRQKERETACCIRNDDSGCVQSSQADCSKTISTWKKWSAGDSGPGGRISGSVCGLDPKFCDAPASIAPYEWPDDITKWPICRKTNAHPQRFRYKDKMAEHMVCEVIAHPCCIGIHGMCRITTREYCDFVKGYFHEEASLCAQVSCLDDVCGMISFLSPEFPDQLYRLWTSLFLHAGVFHLVITLMVQHFLMRDLEKLAGSLRIGIIYIGSGVAGNLASAIFVPYRAEVGPAGSNFGLLACLIVEVLNVWPMLRRPDLALLKLLGMTLALFIVGLLPWVDNYAHLFGFVFGFLLSYALMPFVSFGQYDRHRKIALIWVCLLSAMFLFISLVVLFYVIPVYDCEVCGYFNCIPFTRDLCASQNINFKREEPIV